MFKTGKIMAAAAAATLSVAPAIAAPADLSVGHSARAASAHKGDSDLLGGGLIIAIIAGVAVVVGIVVIATNDKPKSP